MNEFIVQLQAKLDEAKSKGNINSDIDNIQKTLNKLKLQVQIDPNAISNLTKQIESIINQKITLSNINIDQSQINKIGQQTGQQIGSNINKELQSSLNDVKQNISNVLKELGSHKLSTVDLSKMFNLDRANLDTSVKDKVRDLTKELNSLAKEVVTTGSDASWEKITNNISQLQQILNKFGMSRDIESFKESIDILEYFQKSTNGKSIFIGNKSDAFTNTGMTVRELNNQFRNLGVTFTSVSQGSLKLDSIWSELFHLSPGLENITTYGEQLSAVVDLLKTAKEAKFGDKNLQPVNTQQVTNTLADWMSNVDKLQRKMSGLQQDQTEVEKRIAEQASASANTVVKNEQKKQQAYAKTANARKQAADVQGKIPDSESIIRSGRNLISFDNVNDAARKASEHFKELLENEKAVITVSEQFDNNNSLNAFTVNIKRANGEVESLRYTLNNIGTIEDPLYAFISNSGVVNDSGAMKQIRAIENAFASFTQKYEAFKSVHNSKLSGLTAPLSDFESKLQGLKSGVS